MLADSLYCVGIDEAGRGPLAGPVAVGAVMMPRVDCADIFSLLPGIRDSKKLSEKKREILYEHMCVLRRENKIAFAVGLVSHAVIDARGIVAAVAEGIASVLEKISADPQRCTVLLDGSIFAPACFVDQQTIIRGDETEPIISLASIAAKVVRDRKMKELALRYPLYGFEIHKGYGTKVHYEAIRLYGLSDIHRHSYLKSVTKSVVV